MFGFITRHNTTVRPKDNVTVDANITPQGSPRCDSPGSFGSMNSEEQRIRDLEEQLKDLSFTCATALDRVSELEAQLAFFQSSPDTSLSSTEFDHNSSSERLGRLEMAMKTIYKCRAELREPVYYTYN